MAWIDMIKEEEATGRLKELYEKYAEPSGKVDNILKGTAFAPVYINDIADFLEGKKRNPYGQNNIFPRDLGYAVS